MAGELPADGAEGAISGDDATRQEDHGSSQSNKGEGECSGIDGSASSHGNWRRDDDRSSDCRLIIPCAGEIMRTSIQARVQPQADRGGNEEPNKRAEERQTRVKRELGRKDERGERKRGRGE